MTSWQVTYQGYKKALHQLTLGVQQSKLNTLSELEKLGLIHCFEITHTLAWHCLKDFLQYQGAHHLADAIDTTRKAISVKLIQEGTIWMDMVARRNQAIHAYEKVQRDAIVDLVINKYHREFCQLNDRLEALKEDGNKGHKYRFINETI